MKLLPYDICKIATHFSEEEIYTKIKNVVGEKPFWRNPFKEQLTDYEGEITKRHFKIKKKPSSNYKSSVLTEIEGEIFSENGKTYLQLKFKLDTFVLIVFGLMFGVFGIASIYKIFYFLFNLDIIVEKGNYLEHLWIIVVFIIMNIITSISFWSEVLNSKEYFIKLLEGKELR